jgi:hypothetical protein
MAAINLTTNDIFIEGRTKEVAGIYRPRRAFRRPVIFFVAPNRLSSASRSQSF